jgi:hypothetical protein
MLPAEFQIGISQLNCERPLIDTLLKTIAEKTTHFHSTANNLASQVTFRKMLFNLGRLFEQ